MPIDLESAIFFITDADPFPPLDGRKIPVANYYWELERRGYRPEILVPARKITPADALQKISALWRRIRPYGGYYTNEALGLEQEEQIEKAHKPLLFVAPARLMSVAKVAKRRNPDARIILILNDAQWTMNLEALLFGIGWYDGGARHDLLKGLLMPSAFLRELTAYQSADCILLQTPRELARLPWLKKKVVIAPNGVEKPKVTWTGQNSQIFAAQVNFTNRRAGKLRPFISKAWPKIHAENPSLELHLFGPGQELPQWAKSIAGIKYVGIVEDMDIFLSDKRAFLVPLEHATGISNTVLRGLALDMPMVVTKSSSLGVQNLLQETSKVRVAASLDDFVQHSLTVHENQTETHPQQIGSWEQNLSTILEKLHTIS